MEENYESKRCLDSWNFKLIKHYAFYVRVYPYSVIPLRTWKRSCTRLVHVLKKNILNETI
jgi:hypothetical protein